MTIILLLLSSSFSFAQNKTNELDELIALGIQNNSSLKASLLQVEKVKTNINGAYSFDKTNIYYNYDQNNLAFNSQPLKVFGAQQRFLFPTVYGAQKKLNTAEFEKEKARYELEKNKLSLEISKVFYQIVYLQHQEVLYKKLDSLYQNFSKASNRRFELGETNYLEKITAQAKFRQIALKLSQIKNDKTAQYDLLKSIIQSDEKNQITASKIEPLSFSTEESSKMIYTNYLQTVTNNYKSQVNMQKQNWLPDLHLEYFRGTNKGLSQSLNGFQVGIAIPILYSGNISKTKVAQLELQSWEQQVANEQQKVTGFVNQKKNELSKYQEAINYYNQYGKQLAAEIIKVANMSYKQGEIDFFQYIQSLENASVIEVEYLDNVLQFNKTQLDYQYLNF